MKKVTCIKKGGARKLDVKGKDGKPIDNFYYGKVLSEDDFQRIAGERRTIGAPKDFEKVLDVAIPAKIRIYNKKIFFTPTGKAQIESDFEVDEKLKEILIKPFGMPNQPLLDPSPRMLIAIDDTMIEDLLGNLKGKERTYGAELLKNYILPAHEVDGHLDCFFNIKRATFDAFLYRKFITRIHERGLGTIENIGIPKVGINNTWLLLMRIQIVN